MIPHLAGRRMLVRSSALAIACFVAVVAARVTFAQTIVPPTPPAPSAAPAIGRFVRLLGGSGLNDPRNASWQVWWSLNKDLYSGLVRRGELRRAYATDRDVEPPLPRGVKVRLIRPDLELALRDSKTIVRVAAAYALGLLGDPKAEPALMNALRDSATNVQDAVILALGMLDAPGAGGAPLRVHALMDIARDTKAGARLLDAGHVNDQRRATAAVALGMTGHSLALWTLDRLVRSSRTNREVKAAAIAGLGLLDQDEAEAVLLGLLREKKLAIQLRALTVTALGRIGGPGARHRLLLAVTDRKTDVRRAAVLALGQLVPRTPKSDELASAVEKRKALAAGSPALKDLDALIARLEPIAAKETLAIDTFHARRRAVLRSAAAKDREYGVQQFALIALGQVGMEADRVFLFRRLRERVLDIRPFAAIGLGILGARGADEDGAAARALFQALRRERRQDHRIALALALGIRGAGDAAPLIRKHHARTGDPLSRSYFALALAMLGHDEALGDVVETLRDVRERDAVELASMAYGLLADSPSANKLLKQLDRRRNNAELRGVAAGIALSGRTRDLRALGTFIRSREVPASTRAFVIEALGLAGDTRDPSPLARLASAHNYLMSFTGLDRALLRKW